MTRGVLHIVQSDDVSSLWWCSNGDRPGGDGSGWGSRCRTAPVGGCNHTARYSPRDCSEDQYFCGTAHAARRASGRRRPQHVGLRYDRAGGLPPYRSSHADLHRAGLVVEADAAGHGLALSVGRGGQGIRSVREGTAGSLVRKKEGDRGSGYRFVIFVLYKNDWFPIDALLYVVDRALPFYNHDAQASGSLTPDRKAAEIERQKSNQE